LSGSPEAAITITKYFTTSMDFSMEDTQNAAPDAPSMAEVNKLSTFTRKADTQSVTKRYVRDL
jgi:ubiquitin-conjugating enzyme E2 C